MFNRQFWNDNDFERNGFSLILTRLLLRFCVETHQNLDFVSPITPISTSTSVITFPQMIRCSDQMRRGLCRSTTDAIVRTRAMAVAEVCSSITKGVVVVVVAAIVVVVAVTMGVVVVGVRAPGARKRFRCHSPSH